MGREIRRVPPNWEHPKIVNYQGEECWIPLYDGILYAEKAKKWKKEYLEYSKKDEKRQKIKYFFEDNPPPDKYEYTDVDPEECTWYQLYETISEGTPLTPAFETKQGLIEYLVSHGDFWSQSIFAKGENAEDEELGFERSYAEEFVNELDCEYRNRNR